MTAVQFQIHPDMLPGAGYDRAMAQRGRRCCLHYVWRRLWLKMVVKKFVPTVMMGQDASAYRRMLALRLTPKDVDMLYTVFLRIDIDNTGFMLFEDFERHFKLGSYAKFARQTFALLDREGEGGVTFDDFVQSMFLYCTYDHDQLVKFTFCLMNKDRNGRVSRDEMAEYLDLIYGRVAPPEKSHERLRHVMEIFGKSDRDRVGVNLAEFLAFSEKAGLILSPAFNLQNILRHRTLGDRHWHKLSALVEKPTERERNVYEVLDRIRVKKYRITEPLIPPPPEP